MPLSQTQAWVRAEQARIEIATITKRPYNPDMEVTCEHCRDNDTCEYAWDHYNTQGDCLAIK